MHVIIIAGYFKIKTLMKSFNMYPSWSSCSLFTLPIRVLLKREMAPCVCFWHLLLSLTGIYDVWGGCDVYSGRMMTLIKSFAVLMPSYYFYMYVGVEVNRKQMKDHFCFLQQQWNSTEFCDKTKEFRSIHGICEILTRVESFEK